MGGWKGNFLDCRVGWRLLAMTAVFVIARPASSLVIASPAGAWRSRAGGEAWGGAKAKPWIAASATASSQ